MITQEQLPMVAMPSMNDTHLEEIILVNRLHLAAKEGRVDDVATTLNELFEHTKVHFQNEEKMMQSANFPAFAPHKGEHDRHLHEFQSLIEYFEKNRDTKAIVAYIEGNLARWLIDHIKTMDTVTAQFLKESKLF